MLDPWAVLRLPRTSSESQVRDAFRAAALRWHPDRPGGDVARFNEATAAYEAIASGTARPRPRQSPTKGWSQPRNSGGTGFAGTRTQTPHDYRSREAWSDRAWRRRTRPADREQHFTANARTHYRRTASGIPGLGLGLGALLAAIAISATVATIDTTYNFINRGKSFEDTQRELSVARANTQAVAEAKRKAKLARAKASDERRDFVATDQTTPPDSSAAAAREAAIDRGSSEKK
jgi:curved DNA-binding protein CbpA